MSARQINRWGLAGLVATTVGVLALAPRAGAGSPTEELRQSTDRVIEILTSPRLLRAERRAQVREIAAEVFDVPETAKRVLGPHWWARTPAEQAEFSRLFGDLLEWTYLSRIDEYRGQRLEFTGEQVDGDAATVRGRVLMRSGLPIPVESRLLWRSGRWRIYDVKIENVSLVGNYRAQFDRVIRTASYEALVERMKIRIEQLREIPLGVSTAPARR